MKTKGLLPLVVVFIGLLLPIAAMGENYPWGECYSFDSTLIYKYHATHTLVRLADGLDISEEQLTDEPSWFIYDSWVAKRLMVESDKAAYNLLPSEADKRCTIYLYTIFHYGLNLSLR